MKPSTWYFIIDNDGAELAALPERDIAEAYMEDMPWKIEERVIITDPKFAAKALELHDRNLEIATENQRLKADNDRMFGILKECGAVLLLPDQSYSLLPEKLRTFQKCYMSEKRAKIERGDMMVEAQQRAERAEAELNKLVAFKDKLVVQNRDNWEQQDAWRKRAECAEELAALWEKKAKELIAPHYILDPDLRAAKFREVLSFHPVITKQIDAARATAKEGET